MKYLIELVANSEGLEPAITGIEELNAKEKELKSTTTQVSAEQKKMMDDYATKAKLGKASIDKLTEGYKNLGKAATGAFGGEAIKGAVKATESFRSQLRLSRDELTKLGQSGKATTFQLYNMAKGAGALRDNVRDAAQVMNTLSSDTFKLDAAIQGLQVGAAGFQVLSGAAALAGSENEDLQKTLVKLNGIMAITAGVQQIINLTQKETALSIGASIVWNKMLGNSYNQLTGAVVVSTGAARAFRVAMLATGIGAFTAAMAAIILNWEEITDAISGTNKEMRSNAKLRDEASEKIGDEIGEMIKLKSIIVDQSLSYKTRNDALIKLKEIAPEYAKSIKDINATETELNAVIRSQTELLIKREQVRILSNRIAEKEINKSAEIQVTAWQKIGIAAKMLLVPFAATWKEYLEGQKIANEDAFNLSTKADKEQLDLLIKSLGDEVFEVEKAEEKKVEAKKKATEKLKNLRDQDNQLEAEAANEKFKLEKERLDKNIKSYEDMLKQKQALEEKDLQEYKNSLARRRDLEAEHEKIRKEKREQAKKDADDRQKEQNKIEIQEQADKEQAISAAAIEVAQITADTIFQIVNTNRNNEFNAQIQRLNELKNKELSNKELTDAQKERIELRYQKKIAEIKTKQAIADRNAAIAQALINGALAITKILTSVTVLNPAAFAAIAVTAATTASQIAIISAQKIPKFAKGTEFVHGGGTETSDSVPAMLSKGERVIDAKTNKLLKGIPNKLIPDLLMPKITTISDGMDYDRLAKAFSKELANNPALMVNFDKQGFTSFIKSGVTISQIKNNRNGI